MPNGPTLRGGQRIADPIYTTLKPNDPINLGSSHIRISCKGVEIECEGRAILRLKPRLRLVVTADLPGASAVYPHLLHANPLLLRFGHALPVPALLLSYRSSSKGPAQLELLPNPAQLEVRPSPRKPLRHIPRNEFP
jgi:hypothetical protein